MVVCCRSLIVIKDNFSLLILYFVGQCYIDETLHGQSTKVQSVPFLTYLFLFFIETYYDLRKI